MSPWLIAGIGTGVGILGLAYAVRFYIELRRWARLVKYARIAVAYKGKVKLQAPLVEWALWCRQLNRDKDSNGRVIYKMGATSIAITKTIAPPGRLSLWWARRTSRSQATKSDGSQSGPVVREGTWNRETQSSASGTP